jgi:hypothetical protein
VIIVISNQCIHSIWRHTDSHRILELSNRSHSIRRTRGSCHSSQGGDKGCGDDDVTYQVIRLISNQCIHSVWRDADSPRIIKPSNRSHSICRARGSCISSQGGHRGCGDDDVTDQVILCINNQCIHSVRRDTDSLRIVELSNRSHSICRTRESCPSSQGRHIRCGDDDVMYQVITKISNQCIHSVWRDADSNRILKSSNRSHSICRTTGSHHSCQGRDRSCRDDDVTDQVITIISNQCIHSVWRDADSTRIIESSNGAHPICRTGGGCISSQGRDRDCGDDNSTDQVITLVSNQCIHSVWRETDSLGLIELSDGAHPICRTSRKCQSGQGRHTSHFSQLPTQVSR